MSDGEDEGEGHLHWALGMYDERSDRSDEYRTWAKVLATLVFALAVLSYMVLMDGEGDEWMWIAAIWVGTWSTVAISLVAWRVTLHRNRFDVFTLVDLPPEETSDRLERALEGGVPNLSKVNRASWIPGEMARFTVTMDREEEAVVVVKHYGSLEPPTHIHVRSSRNRDEWRDLRRLVDDAFRGAGVPGPLDSDSV